MAATKESVQRRKEPADNAKSSLTAKTEEMDQKIRATNVVYKKLKSYLSDLLHRMSPAAEGQEDSSMARFLQVSNQLFKPRDLNSVFHFVASNSQTKALTQRATSF